MDCPPSTLSDRGVRWFRDAASAHARAHGEGCDVVEARTLLAEYEDENRDLRTTLRHAMLRAEHDRLLDRERAMHAAELDALRQELATRDHAIGIYKKRLGLPT